MLNIMPNSMSPNSNVHNNLENPKNKKLLVLIGSLDVGGTEKHLVSILPKISTQGWSVRVFTFTQKGPLAMFLEDQGIAVSTLLTPQQVKWVAKLPRLLGRLLRIILCIIHFTQILRKENKQNKANTLVHFYLPESYVLGMISAGLAGFSGPKLMSRRSLNTYQSRRPGVAWCEKWLHKKMALITGNSQAILKQLLAEGVEEKNLRLIYNGVNLEAFRHILPKDKVREKLQIPPDALVFIMVANLIPYKGHQDLLMAFAEIQAHIPKPWYLLCVGRDDGIGQALKTQAEQLKLHENILWLGSRNDIPDLLSASDIGLLCSHEEGFSNAILEGMAAGLPMVVTDVGGNKEAVIDNHTGFVVPVSDPKKLAASILKLANNRELAKTFGVNGNQRVLAKFSSEACVQTYIKLYEALLKRETLPSLPIEREICAE